MKRNLVGGAASVPHVIPVKYWWGSRTGGSWYGTHLTVYDNGRITLPPLTTKLGFKTYNQRAIDLNPTDYVQGKLKRQHTDTQIRLDVVPTKAAELTGNKMILDMITPGNYAYFNGVLEKINGLNQSLTVLRKTIMEGSTLRIGDDEPLGSGTEGLVYAMDPTIVEGIFKAFEKVQEAAEELSLDENVATSLFKPVTPLQACKSYTVKLLNPSVPPSLKRPAISGIKHEFLFMKWLKQYDHPYTKHFLWPVAYLHCIEAGFIMERGGISLRDLQRQPNFTELLNENVVSRLALGLARAVSFLHGIFESSGSSRCISLFHVDLKPENILLEYKIETLDNLEDKVRLIDFGFTRQTNVDRTETPPPSLHTSECGMHESKEASQTSSAGSPVYMAPEVWGKIVGGQRVFSYGQMSDMFSYGIIVLELMSKKYITNLYSYFNLSKRSIHWTTDGIKRAITHVFRTSQSVLKDIVGQCLSLEQNDRLTAREVDQLLSSELKGSVSKMEGALVKTTGTATDTGTGTGTATAAATDTEEPQPE